VAKEKIIEQQNESRRLTWDELVALEPRLENLLYQVEESRPSEGESDFNYEGCWGRFKKPICKLVGWSSRHCDERLRTTHAYDTAYRTLLQALHD
jgi:hypothetical protein